MADSHSESKSTFIIGPLRADDPALVRLCLDVDRRFDAAEQAMASGHKDPSA